MTARSDTGEKLLRSFEASGLTQEAYALQHGIDPVAFHTRICNAQQKRKRLGVFEQIPESPYPTYADPLEMEGDALAIPDPEFPFHHAGFLNRVIDLAYAWGIRQSIVAGDAMHFNTFSKWEPNWTAEGKAKGGITADQEKDLLDDPDMPQVVKERLIAKLDRIGRVEEDPDDEVTQAKKQLKLLGSAFDRVDYVIGNHDGRFLAALGSPVMVKDFADYLGLEPKWRIAPYYFSLLRSAGRTFRVEHPKGAAKNTAVKLADKFECSILMAHSHFLDFRMSTSGRHFAIQMGCTVDERRLAYASQRSNTADAHGLGAVIVRDGYPWLLTENTPWERMRRI